MLGRVGGNSRGVTLEEGVEPWTTYEVKLTTDAVANTSAIFFQIKESVTDSGPTVVRAEEVTLVLLVLVLWAVAILLFFHRWGKIRMLEPYQPEYKPLNHSPACPHAAPTPTQAQSRPSNPRPLLPRKSSSLCFTPSMLRAAHVPQSCRISVPQIDQTPVHRCSRAPSFSSSAHAHHSPAHHSPAHHPSSAHHARHRLRLASDSLDHGTTTAHHHHHAVEIARKVRSAENLRNFRISSTHGRGAEEACRAGACHQLEAAAGVHPHPLARRRSCQSHSLDLEHYRGTPTPLLQDVAPRGKSLDSTSVSSLRRSPTAGPSWAGGDPVCTTPELRVSPTPPDTSAPSAPAHHHPHHILLQRQETIDDALLPVPYATLMEEEMENEVSEV
ncbi:uncharacterized protein LOC122261942 [Penaeus japonicus]|uniref:uncharacterized protein LOC122261942 n=1 Tax=Penaeus japonicus TaxID=27405 RepID=UPI001C7151D8|nr:uncharacterized protein LOC122261942 [Penaeus japonicus]